MAQLVREKALREMRAVIGPDASEKHMLHSLYLARDDVLSAINIYFDTPQGEAIARPVPVVKRPPLAPAPVPVPRAHAASQKRNLQVPPEVSVIRGSQVGAPPVVRAVQARGQVPSRPVQVVAPVSMPEVVGAEVVAPASRPEVVDADIVYPVSRPEVEGAEVVAPVSRPEVEGAEVVAPVSSPEMEGAEVVAPISRPDVSLSPRLSEDKVPSSQQQSEDVQLMGKQVITGVTDVPAQISRKVIPNLAKSILRIDLESRPVGSQPLEKVPSAWLLLGQTEVAGISTCRGIRVKRGDPIIFTYPKKPNASSDGKRPLGRPKESAGAGIVRFESPIHGEVGRLPRDWAACVIPLVHQNRVKLVGRCRSAPVLLNIMSTIYIDIRVYINRNFFSKFDSLWRSLTSVNTEATTNLPLPSLLSFLGRKPSQKAEFTPQDLLSRKRSLESDKQILQGSSSFTAEKRRKLATGVPTSEGGVEEISDNEISDLVGATDNSEMQEMEPSNAMLCSLWPYQKQALWWMTSRETGAASEQAAETLHPCWESYSLAETEVSVFYLNVFTGEATLDFPSAKQTAKGGILADAMGLGKTVMTISLIVTNPGRGGLNDEGYSKELDDPGERVQPNTATTSGQRTEKGGGTLIVCPMSLLAQWKHEFETHVTPGHLKVYTHYGGERRRVLKDLLEYDIVLTTYSTLQSEHSRSPDGSPIQSVHWFRVVLDEAHSIKNSNSSCAQAIFSLTADRSWCLTGTPIQNKLEDVFSLLHFLRVEPWTNWAWWNRLIQKPFEEGDERALALLQHVLRPLMLRRTKDTKDKDGRPILELPPADMQLVYCDLSEAERDFYDAVHNKSKIKFDQFVEQGKVLHNYASILELLLRMRQCCDHPFLVMSRSDTDEFADLDKLAKRFLDGDGDLAFKTGASRSTKPTKAFVEEVVADLRKGEKSECPICLEAMEDAVLTPCAHRMCRECLFASWRSTGSGKCPICRAVVNKQDLITAPSDSRFRLDVEKNWVDSSKISVLIQHLETARLQGSKSVVFSQWTAFLDLLEVPLKRRNMEFVRLDGSLSQAKRTTVLEQFDSNPQITIMLLSLKAGGVGLNLTAASNAFLMDPWWNPAVEDQAIMRIHRIGQKNPVVVKRFIAKGTVEEKMLKVQARKQRMITGALTDQHDVKFARIEELKMLFR